MNFSLNLKKGQVLTHKQLANLFDVKTLRNSRFLKEKNTLVIITDYTQCQQPDIWIGDVLHLTVGQKISSSTSAKLVDSRTNSVTLQLFQVMEPGKYTYSGRVKLAGDPYTEIRSENTQVWVFPLQSEDAEEVSKPNGLVFSSPEDFQTRGRQAVEEFLRRRSNYVGCRVQHRVHGLGTVRAFDGTILTVRFDDSEVKTYNFNKSFGGGYLQFVA